MPYETLYMAQGSFLGKPAPDYGGEHFRHDERDAEALRSPAPKPSWLGVIKSTAVT